MGLCGSKSQVDEAKLREEKRRSRELEKAMNKDHQLDQQINKLLLLGLENLANQPSLNK